MNAVPLTASPARFATLVVFFAIAALAVFADIDRSRAGIPTAVFKGADADTNTRFVVSALRGSAPLHVGDHVRIDDPADLAALQYHSLAAGSTLGVVRTQPLPEVALAVPVIAVPRSLQFVLLVLLIEAMFVSIAAFVALRGRSAGSLPLAWFFALLTLLVNPTTPAWPKWALLVSAVTSSSIAVIAILCATEFATRVTDGVQAAWARRTRRAARTFALIAAVINLGVSASGYFATATPAIWSYVASAALIVQALIFFAALVLAYRNAPVNERQRVLWVTASLAAGMLGFILAVILGAADVPEPQRDYPLLLLVAMPLGCAYAILRYRLLDIAFVVNRATVFGVTSLLVLGALAVVDSGLQTLLGSWLVRTGLYVQLGLAVAIGIATRPVHERVDRFVDDVFFRKRHEAERALRRFAREAVYIDDPAAVIERTVDTVERAVNLRCAVWLADAGGWFAAAGGRGGTPLDRNDEAVVRLRATRETVDLRDAESALRGDFAFPMFARNRLLGILVCADKADGTAVYAPDELEAIGAVAHAAGVAIDLLRIEALERALAANGGTAPLGAVT